MQSIDTFLWFELRLAGCRKLKIHHAEKWTQTTLCVCVFHSFHDILTKCGGYCSSFPTLGMANAECLWITVMPCDRLQCRTHRILPPLQGWTEGHRGYERELIIELQIVSKGECKLRKLPGKSTASFTFSPLHHYLKVYFFFNSRYMHHYWTVSYIFQK